MLLLPAASRPKCPHIREAAYNAWWLRADLGPPKAARSGPRDNTATYRHADPYVPASFKGVVTGQFRGAMSVMLGSGTALIRHRSGRRRRPTPGADADVARMGTLS